MATPARIEPVVAPAATRPGSLFGPSTRPADARSTGFGPTVFDVVGAGRAGAGRARLGVRRLPCRRRAARAAVRARRDRRSASPSTRAPFAGWLGAGRARRERRDAGGAGLAARRLRPEATARRRCRWPGSGSRWSRSARSPAASRPISPACWCRDSLVALPGGWRRRRRSPAAALAATMFQWLRLRAKATLPAETKARLAELQSRIRPHFLFNTLNTALALVRLDPTRAEGRARGPGRAVPRRDHRQRRIGDARPRRSSSRAAISRSSRSASASA